MATIAAQPAVDLSPLWECLFDLTWSQIPSDLTEIDAHWCYCHLVDSKDDQVATLLHQADWDAMNGFAQSIRAIWDRAREAGDEFGANLRDW